MRSYLFTGGMVILILISMNFVLAETPQVSSPDNWWNGSWMSDDYTVLILQNDANIAGSYDPEDISVLDPGLLKGTLSKDKKTFSGIWSESGTITYILSDDLMSFSGVGTVNQEGNIGDPFTYLSNATREGEVKDLNNTWTGTWKSASNIYTFTQNGSVVFGSYSPFHSEEDEPGHIDGVVSEDGKKFTGSWVETGNFTFVLSEDKKSYTGTYTTSFSDSGSLEFWNGTKME
ncbi:hypothetical protein DSECCO2_116440 [anaerobic digester metagenome]|jgi:hypothetical protein